jgi:hypothetical protein
MAHQKAEANTNERTEALPTNGMDLLVMIEYRRAERIGRMPVDSAFESWVYPM